MCEFFRNTQNAKGSKLAVNIKDRKKKGGGGGVASFFNLKKPCNILITSNFIVKKYLQMEIFPCFPSKPIFARLP